VVTDAEVLLFVPASPVHETGLAPYGVEVRQLANGQYGCLAFSTVDRLTDALGGYQPWVGVQAGELVRYLDRAGVASLYVDPALPDEAWRWQPGQMRELAAREEGQWQRATR
jgi:hypothetical protein